MSSGQDAGAERRVVRETIGIEPLDRNSRFHVPQLADIEIATCELRPPKEWVTGGLHDALAGDYPLSIVREWALAEMRLQRGR